MSARQPAPLMSTRALQRLVAALVAMAGIVLLAGAGIWFVQRPWFDLRQIDLRAADGGGLRHVNANAVRAALLGRLSGNFFTLDLERARRVFESVPWVAAVSVRRGWPDRLLVTVTEHRAIAVWDDGRLLSDRGLLFVANLDEAEVAGPLPAVDAPERLAGEVARRLPRFAADLTALGLTLEAIEVSERAGWTLRADSGLTIELGRDDPPGRIDERLARVVGHFQTAMAQVGAELLRIDARYPQGFAVAAARRKP